ASSRATRASAVWIISRGVTARRLRRATASIAVIRMSASDAWAMLGPAGHPPHLLRRDCCAGSLPAPIRVLWATAIFLRSRERPRPALGGEPHRGRALYGRCHVGGKPYAPRGRTRCFWTGLRHMTDPGFVRVRRGGDRGKETP